MRYAPFWSQAVVKRVLFVCLGNICRSPTAHGVFLHKVIDAGLQAQIEIDSAGTAAWHTGKSPDERSQAFAARRGYDLSALRARQVCEADFYRFDYILAMDRANMDSLAEIAPNDASATVSLLLNFGSSTIEEVPDPYYGGDDGFNAVLDLVEDASEGLLQALQRER
ncbi:low molecular weight protein-tyrosine-phosphatase [Spongiibacter sp. UBA1325]|uniref:low molecular weight protein-tyrosine-phosphatase n=1 Tax=Spongiibacter sp. UBA1325 TaxID=1947543 RepID=UPI00257C88B1|nr:low molecular weight protein-tyrosine-phosphatase [Spongiibacter sp. UBA1325]|tara:strand:- start:1935 stop:2435 length:501 start_codon:yes stop_codon:yes gene_type:complete